MNWGNKIKTSISLDETLKMSNPDLFTTKEVMRVAMSFSMKSDICGVRVMGFNTTFNNISAKLWWPVLLVEETGVPRQNHQPAISH